MSTRLFGRPDLRRCSRRAGSQAHAEPHGQGLPGFDPKKIVYK